MKGRIDNWIYIDDIKEIPKNVTAIHCDTRDFHCNLHLKKPELEGFKVENLVKYKSAKKSMLIAREEILPWLKNIETMSGGRGSWRHLFFNNVKYDGWLKYIRIYHYQDDKYIVCNEDSAAIHWRECVKENLPEEYEICFIGLNE
jgi:hypothetical protein|nr:MAG TPA: hypothetical protein [Crassvirales sp.]